MILTSPSSCILGQNPFTLPVGNKEVVPRASRGRRIATEDERSPGAPRVAAVVSPAQRDCAAGRQKEVDPAAIHVFDCNNPKASALQATVSFSAEAGES